jgi:hypothetical protein
VRHRRARGRLPLGRAPGTPRGRRGAARHWRPVAARACIAVSSCCLLLLVLYPPLRHHAEARGLGIAVSAAVSIVAGLAYLRSRR